MEMKSEYVLEMKNINKHFPGVKALSNANLDLKYGEVLALCGENGAGKSTMMKVLSGVFQPDDDKCEIIYNGKHVRYKNPMEAKNDGIILIFQELSLVKDLSVAENIYLGSLPIKNRLVDWKSLLANASSVLQELDCHVSPKELIGNLPIAQQQLVEIARGIALGAKVLILDEPTSSLTEKEKNILFNIVNKLKSQGVGIIYITHKMDEVFQISDRVLVFRDGKPTGKFITKDIKLDDILQSMIGRTLDNYYHKSHATPGEEVLKAENLTVEGLFSNISFSVRRGEVLGLYGLVGAGRTEIVETIFGIRKPTSGQIYLHGKKTRIRNSVDAVKRRIGFVTENRKEQGLVLNLSCRENISLAKLPLIQNYGFVKMKETYNIYNEYQKKLSISSPSSEQKVVNLSGGNQQKVIIGKWMCISPELLILDEPTRGIDVGSKAEIHKLIAEMAEAGLAIIVISSEMPEIMGISNRLIAISQGKIAGMFMGDEITESEIIKAITIK